MKSKKTKTKTKRTEPMRVIRPRLKWQCDTITGYRGKVHTKKPGDVERCECRGREYKCAGCGRWKPWCNGGAPDERCDDCVAAAIERGEDAA